MHLIVSIEEAEGPLLCRLSKRLPPNVAEASLEEIEEFIERNGYELCPLGEFVAGWPLEAVIYAHQNPTGDGVHEGDVRRRRCRKKTEQPTDIEVRAARWIGAATTFIEQTVTKTPEEGLKKQELLEEAKHWIKGQSAEDWDKMIEEAQLLRLMTIHPLTQETDSTDTMGVYVAVVSQRGTVQAFRIIVTKVKIGGETAINACGEGDIAAAIPNPKMRRNLYQAVAAFHLKKKVDLPMVLRGDV